MPIKNDPPTISATKAAGELTYILARSAFFAILAVLSWVVLTAQFSQEQTTTSPTRPTAGRYKQVASYHLGGGLYLRVDKITGCHYLVKSQGGVTPRLRVVDGVAVPWCDPPKDKTP